MACLWSDGFDGYGTTAEAQTRYTSATINQLITSTSFGVGQAVGLTTAVGLQANFETGNEVTIYGSVRLRYPSGTPTGSAFSLTLQDSTTDQVTIQWLDSATIQVRSGGVAGTVIGSVVSALTLNQWDSWQFKIVIGDTGSIEIRKNGGNTATLNLTSVDTRGGTTTSCNRFTIGSPTSQWQLDDFYLNSDNGTAPTSWPGDVRIIYMPVATTTQRQLLNNQPLVSITPLTGVSTIATPSGTARYAVFSASFSGTIGSATITMGAAGTGHMKAAFYGVPATTPLATSTEVTNPGSGTLTFTFPTPLAVTKGQALYFAVDQDFSASYTVSATGGWTSSTAYSSFPAANPVLGTMTNGVACTILVTTNNNAEFVATADSDTTTVYSALPGQKDIYGVLGMGALNPASIIGLRLMAEWRKSDAGTRGGTVGVNANSSGDVAQINNITPSLTYGYATKYMPTDPTGASWTVANVNNMRISLSVGS